jgi:hypothetical protein
MPMSFGFFNEANAAKCDTTAHQTTGADYSLVSATRGATNDRTASERATGNLIRNIIIA